MLARPGLSQTGLASSGLSNPGVGGSSLNPLSQNLVIDYPLVTDLIDQKGAADGTVTRSTVGNYVSNTSGLLTQAAINAPRFEVPGLMCEGAATNYCLYNEDLTNAAWNFSSNVNALTKDTTVRDPEGGFNAWKLEATATGAAYLAQVTAGLNSNSGSVWLRKGNVDSCSWGMLANPASTFMENVDLSGGEWVRRTGVASGASDSILLAVNEDNIFGSSNPGDYILVYLPQLQDGVVPTSDIKTAASSVTRTSEQASLDDANLPAPGAAQTIAFDFTIIGDLGSTQSLWKVNGETTPRRALVSGASRCQLYFGTNFVQSGVDSVDPKQTYRAVISSDGANFTGYIDNVSLGTAAVAGIGGTPTDILLNHSNTGHFHIKNFRVYDTDITADEVKYA